MCIYIYIYIIYNNIVYIIYIYYLLILLRSGLTACYGPSWLCPLLGTQGSTRSKSSWADCQADCLKTSKNHRNDRMPCCRLEKGQYVSCRINKPPEPTIAV